MAKKRIVKEKRLVKSGTRTTGRKGRLEAYELQDTRTPQAKTMDAKLYAPFAETVDEWAKDPNRLDIKGVDVPIDWRDSTEKQLIEYIESGATPPLSLQFGPEYDYSKMHPKELKARLEYQKKHPLRSAIIYTHRQYTADGGIEALDKLDGIRNWKWAQDKEFQMDIWHLDREFIDRFNLKQQDIHGLHFMPLANNSPTLKDSNAFYLPVGRTMFLPNKGDFVIDSHGTKGITHEIGHHIMNTSMGLRAFWMSNDKYNWKYTMPIAKADIVVEKMSLMDAFNNRGALFGEMLPIRDLRLWRNYYERRGIRGAELEMYIMDEAFAETFRVYRDGTWSKIMRLEQRRLDKKIEEIAELKTKLETQKAEGLQGRAFGTEAKIREEERYKRHLEVDLANSKQLYDIVRKLDAEGWKRKTGKDVVPRTKWATLRPNVDNELGESKFYHDIKEGDYLVHDGDVIVGVLAKGPKSEKMKVIKDRKPKRK